MILFFSGTGNSEYVARAIGDRLCDKVVSLNQYVKEDKTEKFHSEKPYVFVFPVYISIIPKIVREAINKMTFTGNQNAYFVSTCARADGSVPNAAKELCSTVGSLKYMGCKKVVMPQNYIILFKPTAENTKEELYRNALTTVDEICEIIMEGKVLAKKERTRFEYVCTKYAEKWYNSRLTKTKSFTVGNECIGCGICQKRCPTNSIMFQDNKPVWTNKVCIHCMACISYCPKNAIEYGKMSAGKIRQVCPEYKGK